MVLEPAERDGGVEFSKTEENKNMKLRRLIQAAAICCVVFVGCLSASTITQTCTITSTGVPFTNACSLNEFNPATGTLTGVTLTLTSVNGDVIPEQTDISATPFTFTGSTATIGLTFAATGVGAIPDTIAVTDTSSPCSGTVNGDSTNTTCTATVFSGLSATAVTGTTADYIGVGTITPVFDASGQILGVAGAGGPGSAGSIFFGGDGSIGGTFTLTYTYTAAGSTPEPATMAMVGGLLIGLAALARKRRA